MAGTVRNCFGAHVIGIIGTVLLSQLLYVSASSEGTPAHSLTDGLIGCYTCTSTEEGSLCETNPSTLDHSVLKSCPRDVCTIVRVEGWPSRRVKSFYRGCDGRTKVFERNNCQIEKDERTCFTACVGDLCNFGDGLVDGIVNSGSISAGGYRIDRVLKTIGAVLVTFTSLYNNGCLSRTLHVIG